MEPIIIHPENKEQVNAIKAVLKALKVPFEKAKTYLGEIEQDKEEDIWNDNFVREMKRREEEFKKGSVKSFTWEEVQQRAKDKLSSL